MFEIWYYEHPTELLVPNPKAGNSTWAPLGLPRGQDRVNAIFVTSATPTQALINVILIAGTFLGDRYHLSEPFFTFFGAFTHLAIGIIFIREASDGRYEHRRARTTLGASVAVVGGLSHLLASVMFAVMREERTAIRKGEDGEAEEGGDEGPVKVLKPHSGGKERLKRRRRDDEATMLHMALESASYVPIYRRWYRKMAMEEVDKN